MLWKYGVGPMIAGSVIGYRITEPHNYQLTKATKTHRSLVPRLEAKKDGVLYTTAYFTSPKMTECGNTVTAISGLADKNLNRIKNDTDRTLTYSLTENGIKISISGANESSFVLPLIAGELELLCGQADRCEEIFFLTGGFIAKEYTIIPDKDGRIELIIR